MKQALEIDTPMTRTELRASLSLAGIYMLRMLGLFMILPVFSIYARHLEGATPALIGLAISAYGLTQALPGIPYGLWSDHVGRKKVIAFGLLVFAIGSGVAAMADSIWGVILGRSIQGAGAVASVVMALAADLWLKGGPDTIRREAVRDDGGRLTLLLVTVVISLAVLIVTGGLVQRGPKPGPFDIGLIVATLMIAWAFANLVYAFHYARLFYDQDSNGKDKGGLDFPGDGEPCFADFVNFSFVLGMTCQTADIAITSPALRRISTVHGIVAFFFNLGVLALVVNVVASSL